MRISEFSRKLQLFVMLTIGTYPVNACLVVFLAPELLSWMWLFSATFLALGLLSFAIPGKLRLGVGFLGAVLFLVPCAVFVKGDIWGFLLLLALGHSVMLFWSIRIPGWDATEELPFGWLNSCFIFLMVGYVLSSREPRLASVALWIKVSLFVYVFLALRSMNRSSLNLASGGRQAFSSAMRRKNVLLTVGMFAIAVLVALIPSVGNLLEQIYLWLKQLIESLKEMFPEATEATVVTTTEAVVDTSEDLGFLFDGLKTHQTSDAAIIIMTVLVLAIVIPVGGFILYQLGKRVWNSLQQFIKDIVDGANAEAEDFVDEVTDTREDAQQEQVRKKATRVRRLASSVRKMSPEEQIRYRYRWMSSKHPEWKEQSTARENLSEAAAQLYERARYSEHPITVEDAQCFKEQTSPKADS